MSTAAILWSYQDSNGGSDFWGAATISNRRVYAGNQDGNLYVFGTRSPVVKFQRGSASDHRGARLTWLFP